MVEICRRDCACNFRKGIQRTPIIDSDASFNPVCLVGKRVEDLHAPIDALMLKILGVDTFNVIILGKTPKMGVEPTHAKNKKAAYLLW